MAPKAKKALLAFFIASSMAFVADRSQDHQYPKHFAYYNPHCACAPRVNNHKNTNLGIKIDTFGGDTSCKNLLYTNQYTE